MEEQNVIEFADDSVIFLIGAGCSRDANIPMSMEMVRDIEGKIEKEPQWAKFKDLYHYLKASILYADGIFGEFNKPFNVEKLLIIISEIEKKEKNKVYPFIGTWNNKLIELAGQDFQRLKDFKELIVSRLNEWVKLKDFNQAEYYEGFLKFSLDIKKHIRIFSLNYDLCIERIISQKATSGALAIEDGFDPTTKLWDYDNFYKTNDNNDKNIFLYKLHGSINWYVENSDTYQIKKSDEPLNSPELIFGIEAKMQSNDPYLFYTYQFRYFTLNAACKLIVVVGYSYADDYINRIIRQALIKRPDLHLLSVTKADTDEKLQKEKQIILESLNLTKLNAGDSFGKRIFISGVGAKNFLQLELTAPKIDPYISKEDNAF